MNKFDILTGVLSTVKFLTFIGLFAGAGIFVKDVWTSYRSKSTGIKVYKEKHELLKSPAVTICFNPGAKISVLKKYDISYKDFWTFNNESKAVTYTELFEEAVYRIGRDFSMHVWWNNGKSNSTITEESQFQSKGIKIELVYTNSNGLCYILVLKEKVKPTKWFSITININETIEKQYLPDVDFFFTSEENAMVTLTTGGVYGQFFKSIAKPHDNALTDMYLQPIMEKKLPEISQCQYKTSQIKCASKRYVLPNIHVLVYFASYICIMVNYIQIHV